MLLFTLSKMVIFLASFVFPDIPDLMIESCFEFDFVEFKDGHPCSSRMFSATLVPGTGCSAKLICEVFSSHAVIRSLESLPSLGLRRTVEFLMGGRHWTVPLSLESFLHGLVTLFGLIDLSAVESRGSDFISG